MSRRLAIAAASGLVAGLATFYYATRVETRRYRLEKVRLEKKRGLTGGAGENGRPFRIIHLSDLHLKEPESHKIEFLKRITDQPYDLLALTGDIFEDYTGIKYATDIFSRRPAQGAYAVLGNHDYYQYNMMNKTVGRVFRRLRHPLEKRDVIPMVEALESSGVTVLRNDSQTLADLSLHIVGVDYPTAGEDEIGELNERADEDHFKLALIHVPMKLDCYRKLGFDLVLGGHTHGGQIRVPGYGAIITDSELPGTQASGLFFRGSTAFHVSRGIGADPRTNIRFFCPPAATVIEIY